MHTAGSGCAHGKRRTGRRCVAIEEKGISMQNFASLGLSENALDAVKRLGYDEPTPVQEQAIPLVLEGRDLIAAASTGTGKTAAFLLPVLSQMTRDRSHKRPPRLLVVSPTRELAQQIAFTAMKIARCTGQFVTTVFGGSPYGPQIKEIRRGTDVLIATPGRLNDLMTREVVDLSSIQTLVLDEADRMLDMGFLPDVTTIVKATPDERQTLLFSATIDESIQKNLGNLLKDPAIVEIAHKGETAKTVEQFMMPIKQDDKPALLRAVLEEKGHDRVIVFARTRGRAEDFAKALREDGYEAESIHSDKSVGARRRALDKFRRGKANILVATDVLARGIDVPSVDYVINLDLPDCPEDYVHRIGRTGRAGETGYAISFVSPKQRRLLADIEKLIDREIPFMDLDSYDLDRDLLNKKGKGRGNSGRNGSGKRHDGRGHGGRGGRREGELANRSERRAARFGNDSRDGRGDGRDRDRGGRNDRGGKRGDSRGGKRNGRDDRNNRNGQRDFKGKKHDKRNSKPSGNKGAAATASKRNKKRPSNMNDVRSFGERRNREKSQRR